MTPLDPAIVLGEAREELNRADAKASMLLAAAGVAAGVIGAALLAGSWTPDNLSGCAQHLWWIGVAVLGLGALLLGLAVWPRVSIVLPQSLGAVARFLRALGFKRIVTRDLTQAHYFDQIALFDTPDALAVALNDADAEARTITQLLAISKIVRLKYRLIRWAMGSLALGIALILVAIIRGR